MRKSHVFVGVLLLISAVLAVGCAKPPQQEIDAAKAALNALTANLRMELRADYPEIHVSKVLPGVVATEFGETLPKQFLLHRMLRAELLVAGKWIGNYYACAWNKNIRKYLV